MNTSSDTPRDNHYFTAQPASESHRRPFSITVGDTTLSLVADSGVFSQYGLDKGTAVLLDTVSKMPMSQLSGEANLCDVGCGSGAIALTLAVLYPECTVYAVDVNERARELCAENAHTNGLSNVQVMHPDDIPSSLEFDLMWSNPPIRIGKDALHQLLNTWLNKLSARGIAHLVVSKNLGADSLTEWIRTQSFTAQKIASSKGFRVIEVRKNQ